MKALNDQFLSQSNLHKAFYKQNHYGYVILKKTVESTVQIGQLDLHKVASFKVLYKRSNDQFLSLGTLHKAFY